MSQYNLDRIFQPRRVAVVGASESPGSIDNALMKNLIEGGFQGKLLPVNPKYHTVHGYSAVGSVSALDAEVDLAVIAMPIHTVPDIVRACVEKKIAVAIVISAGGKEVGEKGREIEERIRATAHAGGLRIVGPNGYALSDPAQGSTPISRPKCR
jgi:acetyltransferase